jgi:formylglycine-generating enzyme required for sulfatase activity
VTLSGDPPLVFRFRGRNATAIFGPDFRHGVTRVAPTDWHGDARGGEHAEADSYDPAQPQFRVPRKVIRGGSFLCADSYCLRYRPAARRPQPVDTGMSHIGFRCIVHR